MEYLKQKDFDKEISDGKFCIQFSANWCGPCKTITATIDSIENKIFNIFKSKNVDYDVFLHSFYFEGNLNISYTSEKNVKLDFDEYKLLKPKYYKIDNQDEVIKTIDFKKYMYQDRCHNNMQMLRNAVLSLYSQKEVTKLVTSFCE